MISKHAILSMIIVVFYFTLSTFYYQTGEVPTKSTLIFDLMLVVTAIVLFVLSKVKVPSKTTTFIFIFSTTYGVVSFDMSLNSHLYDYLYEFARGYRFLLYLFLFSYIKDLVKRNRMEFISLDVLKVFVVTTGYVFLLVYLMQSVQGKTRPEIFSENNFEMPYLIGLFFIYYLLIEKKIDMLTLLPL